MTTRRVCRSWRPVTTTSCRVTSWRKKDPTTPSASLPLSPSAVQPKAGERDVRRSKPSRPRRAPRGQSCRKCRCPSRRRPTCRTVPELPEVETVRADLGREIVGRPIAKVDVTGLRSTRRHPDTAEFVAALQGTTVVSVGRRGKYLLLRLDDGTTVVVHLRMSGQLVHAASAAEERAKHTHVVLTFADGGQLRFVDPRTFGEWFVADLVTDDPVTHLGPEPLDPRLTASRFGDLLRRRKVRLKSLLLDQRFLAGVGNIYGDEILFAARLRPDRRSDTLTDVEVRRLHRALRATLRDAITH